MRRTGWWISRGDLSREISPASSRGRQLPWCRPRDDGSLPVTEPFITSIYQPPLHLALESEHSTAIYSLRIVINVDRSVPCYSTSLPSPFLLRRSLSPPLFPLCPPLSSSTTYVHTFLDVDSVLTMRVHLLDRRTARWKRRKGSPPSCCCCCCCCFFHFPFPRPSAHRPSFFSLPYIIRLIIIGVRFNFRSISKAVKNWKIRGRIREGGKSYLRETLRE